MAPLSTRSSCTTFLVIVVLLMGKPQPASAFILEPLIAFFLGIFDWILWGQHPTIPFVQCGLKFLLLDFQIRDFNRYPEYFRDDSVVRLAQTGEFEKAQGIEEYVKFASSTFSPYYATGADIIAEQRRYDSYDRETGQCKFLQFQRVDVGMDPQYTPTNANFAIGYGLTLYLNYRENYVPKADILFSEQYMKLLFQNQLSSPESRAYVCSVMRNACAAIVETPDDCENQLEMLDKDETPPFRTDGNSEGCRSLHAAFAPSNPTGHCPHLSLLPMEDPNGKIKCQTTFGYTPQDFFSEAELEEFRVFLSAQGIDPALGYLEL